MELKRERKKKENKVFLFSVFSKRKKDREMNEEVSKFEINERKNKRENLQTKLNITPYTKLLI